MKTTFITILALCLVGYTYTAQGTCAAASHCMGCTDDATTCFACFNWGSGKIGAKQLATNACANAVANTVTDCKYYKGTITATKSSSDCAVCNSKDWLNVVDNNTAASIAITCSDTATNTTTCNAKVSNCMQSLCYTAAGGTVTKGCAMCDKGYTGSGTQVSTLGYTACSTTGVVTNCEYGLASDNTKCYSCKSDYAVASTDTSCTAFTTDSNCRKISSTWCHECWHSYYFSSQKCTLAAKLFIYSGLIAAVLAFLN